MVNMPASGQDDVPASTRFADRRRRLLSLQSFLREGRVVGLCWANQNLKDLKGRASDCVSTCVLPSLPRVWVSGL